MKKVLKNTLSIMLTLTIILSSASLGLGEVDFGTIFSVKASAASSGTCGDNLTWTLDDEGTLTISGSGEMTNFSSSSMPWSSLKSSIKNIVINSGATNIGKYAFYNCTSLTSIVIPGTVTKIGSSAFASCSNLEYVFFGGTTEDWANIVTSGTTALTNTPLINVIVHSESTGHVYAEEWTVDVESTCTTDGSKSRHCICEDCDKKIDVTTIPSLGGHISSDEWTIDKAATCTEEGSKSCLCTVCGEVITEVIEPGHIYGEWDIISEPTCTEDGSKYKTCSVCGDVVIEAIEANGHEHADEWTIDKAATCTEEGSKSCLCTVCGDVVTEAIAIIDHTYSDEWTIDTEPTCTTIGSKSHHCTVCGDKTDVTEIETPGHSYGDWVIIEPTCTNDGSKSKTCATCGDVVTEVIDANGHSYSDEWTIDTEPTCTTIGSKSHHCAVCGDKADVTEIEPLGHSYGDWVIIEPTCTNDGSKSKTCATCGDVVTEVIDANGHSYSDEWTIDTEPTCTTIGSKSHHCAVCGDKADVTEIEPLGHSYGDWVVTTEPTCTEKGSKNKTCSSCSDVVTEEIPENGHSYSDEWTTDKEPTCATGSKSHHCIYCDAKTDITIIEATEEHSYTYTKDYDTNTKTGVCSVCDDTVTVDMVSEDYLTFELNEDGKSYCVTDCYNSSTVTEIEIPAIYNGLPVTHIIGASDVFRGDGGFGDCSYITSLKIPASIKKIGSGAFYNCSALKEVHIEDISAWCSIDFDSHMASPRCIGYVMGYSYPPDCSYGPAKFYLNGELITDVVIADGTTKISDYAFFGWNNIKSITIPDSVTNIGDGAFVACTSLASVEIPDSVTSIGDYAFYDCDSLTSIEVPDSVTNIGGAVFYGCGNIKEVKLSKNITVLPSLANPYATYDGFFAGCTSLKSIVILDGVKSIEEYTFAGCTSLESIVIPNSVTSIGDCAFGDCTSLDYVFYTGSESDWGNITIGGINENLTNATIHYNSTDHTYQWIVETEPTCTEDGLNSYECIYCALQQDTEVIPAGHSYSTEWTIDVGATCTTAGSKSHHCTVCGDKADVTEIEPLGHSYGDWVIIEPTCINDGSKSKTCATCGDVVTEVIDANGHSYSDEWTIDTEPTCTTIGSKSHHCAVCGDKADVTEIEPLGHSYGDWVVTTEPTCTEDGVADRTCSVCGDVEKSYYSIVVDSSEYPESDHNYGNSISKTYSFSYEGAEQLILVFSSSTKVESNYDYIYIYDEVGNLYGKYTGTDLAGKTITLDGSSFTIKLTSDGSQTYYGFSFASITAVKNLELDITKAHHTYSTEWTIDEEPTCTETGSKSHHCIYCDAVTDVTEIDANGHSYSDEWTIDTAPNCTTAGSKSHHCTVCGDKTDVTEIEAPGHSYGDWVVTTEPTCTEKGSKNKTCSACGDVVTEAIAIIDHTYSTEWTVDIEPTCGEVGSKSRHCAICGDKADITEIEATGEHTVEEYENDYTTDKKSGICSACGSTITLDMVSVDYLTFELNEDGESYCVTGCYNSSTFTEIEIPATYNGLPVTSIGDEAFMECAFTQITIPDSVISIGECAFLYCPSLTEINVVEGNPNYCSENGVLFDKQKTTLIQYPTGNTNTSYSIPDSVISIGYGAFYNCRNLTSITIPDSVTSISGYVFSECVNLSSITIGSGVTSIGSGAFSYCYNLTFAIIPDSVTYIEEYAFESCLYLSEIFYSGTEAEWNALTSQAEDIIPSSTTVYFNDYEHNCSGELCWVTEKQFTCTENGVVSLKCSDCSQVLESVEIRAACVLKFFETSEDMDEYEGLIILEPTCVSDGSVSSVCVVCGKDATRAVHASDDWHSYNYDEWVVDVEPTCGASGSKSYHCEYCDSKTYITEIEPTGEHTYSTEWTIDKEATCVEEGSKSHHCLYCEAKTDVTVIEATGEHTYGDWELTIKPTCEEYGEAERSCSVCGDVQNSMDYDGELDIIEPLGHTYSGDLIVTLKPTCIEEGEGYKECDTCGYEEWESVAKTGHTFGEWEIVRTSCLEDGYSKRVCFCCDAIQTKDTDGKIILDESYITYTNASGAYIVSVEYPGAESIEITFGDISGASDIFIIVYEDGSYQQVDVGDYSYSTHTFTGGYVAFGVSALFSSNYCIEIESAVVYEEPEENLEATGHNYVIDSYDADHPHTKVYKCSYCGETKTETATFSNCLECNFTFTALDVSSYKVVSYTGTGSTVVVPGKYNNCTVTTIANGCFKGNADITSVEIENGITTIGSIAFMNCTNLEKVIIPASVTSIGANAFYGFTGTIYCFSGSTAHQYAIDNNIPYVLMSFSGKGTTKVDYVDFLVRTSIQCCDDLTELFEMSDSVLAVPMASYVYGNLELYGTGTIISVFDGDTYVGDFTLIVEGDTNGDSVCDVLDCVDVQLASAGYSELSGANFEAADCNSDDTIDVIDYQNIVNIVLAS